VLDLGGSLLPLDGDASTDEVRDLADAFSADLIVVSATAAAAAAATTVTLPCGLAAIPRQPATDPAWRIAHDTGPLVLKVTSGSTGASKVVVASEHNVWSDGQHVAEVMDIRASDVSLATVPMAHGYGMGNLLLPLLLKGSPVVLRDRFMHAQWASDVTQFGITMFPGVPFIFDYLRRLEETAAPIAGIRLIVTAGAPIDASLVRYFKDRFGVKVHSLYGTSETGSITFDSSDDVGETVSVGWPLPGTAVTLMPSAELDGGGGRVKVAGAAVALRYAYDDAAAERSSEFTPDGFLTADIGAFSDDGRLTLLGRVSGFVNVAGRKVHPGEVERVIADMPGIVEVRVLGVADSARGQDLVACVQRRDAKVSVVSIRTHCAARLAPYKVPRRIVFVDEWPVSARGKIDRRALEALLVPGAGRTDGL